VLESFVYMVNPRDVLNELKWHHRKDLDESEIWYIHRGAPEDTKIINGDEIKKIGRSFMYTEYGMIPFHRILKIVHRGKIVFERK